MNDETEQDIRDQIFASLSKPQQEADQIFASLSKPQQEALLMLRQENAERAGRLKRRAQKRQGKARQSCGLDAKSASWAIIENAAWEVCVDNDAVGALGVARALDALERLEAGLMLKMPEPAVRTPWR